MKSVRLVVASMLALAFVACGGDKEAGTKAEVTVKMPFEPIAAGEENPGDNGPDDDTVIASIEGSMGDVKFSHFTHSSNAKGGYGVPCEACHHTTADGEFPESGCEECHKLPNFEVEPAHGGPDDNMMLFGKTQDFAQIAPVFFDHFKHAASDGHKVACTSCHHMEGDFSACGECHGERGMQEDAVVIPRLKRAFHQQCKDCHLALKATNAESTAPTGCKECHSFEQPERLEGSLTLNRAFHLACVGCHEGVMAANPKSKAPVRECAGCHKKEAPAPKVAKVVSKPAVPSEPPATGEAAGGEAAAPVDKGPAKLVIDYAKKAKTGTPFDHHLHQEMGEDCAKCHHEGLKDPSCSNCHKDAAAAKKAFHKVCIGCHKENGAPKKCVNCHPKG